MVVSCPSINVTVPDPLPATVRLSVNCSTLNVALQLRAASIVTVAVCAFPLQFPCFALQSLDLRKTEITDAGLVNLKGLTGLQWLYLMGTKVTEAGVAELKKALPNCKIAK